MSNSRTRLGGHLKLNDVKMDMICDVSSQSYTCAQAINYAHSHETNSECSSDLQEVDSDTECTHIHALSMRDSRKHNENSCVKKK